MNIRAMMDKTLQVNNIKIRSYVILEGDVTCIISDLIIEKTFSKEDGIYKVLEIGKNVVKLEGISKQIFLITSAENISLYTS